MENATEFGMLVGRIVSSILCKRISLIIAHEVSLNKASWVYQSRPDIKRIKEIITEQESDALDPDLKSNDFDLLKMDFLVRRYEQKCKYHGSHFIYAYSYKDRVFYNVDGRRSRSPES